MTAEAQNNDFKAKIDHGRSRLLALMALYLVLAVTVGVVRNELQAAGPAPQHLSLADPAPPAPAQQN